MDHQAASMVAVPRPPEDFRCPISLELMADPVILCTGQSYDRPSIQRWLDAGHRTCPKTKQELHHDARLIPNYALRSLIHQWAQAHSVELRNSSEGYGGATGGSGGDSSSSVALIKRQLVESLVKNSSSGSNSSSVVVRDAVREIRILAKESKQTRAMIAEAGGVARILALLLSAAPPCSTAAEQQLEAEIEENAVVALLNLSTDDDENKVGLVAEGAVDAILHALGKESSSMDTKASAALAITSLAMVDVNKATIGRRREAMPALVSLLKHGSPRGRKDAAIALYSLCMLPENRPRAVAAAVVPVLLSVLPPPGASGASASPGVVGEDRDGAAERALALLDALSACAEGRVAITKAAGVAPALVAALAAQRGSERSRESAAAVLCSVCAQDRRWALLACKAGAVERAREMLRDFEEDSRARRKAARLLGLLQGGSQR